MRDFLEELIGWSGAVSVSWWGGTCYGIEEGYLLVHLERNDIPWEYVD